MYHKHNFLSGVQRGSGMFAFILIVRACKDRGLSCCVTWFVLSSFRRTLTHTTNAVEERWVSSGSPTPNETLGFGEALHTITAHIGINLSVFRGCLSTSSIPIRAGFYCLKCLWFQESVLPKARLLLKYVLLYIHSSISPSPI